MQSKCRLYFLSSQALFSCTCSTEEIDHWVSFNQKQKLIPSYPASHWARQLSSNPGTCAVPPAQPPSWHSPRAPAPRAREQLSTGGAMRPLWGMHRLGSGCVAALCGQPQGSAAGGVPGASSLLLPIFRSRCGLGHGRRGWGDEGPGSQLNLPLLQGRATLALGVGEFLGFYPSQIKQPTWSPWALRFLCRVAPSCRTSAVP